MTAMVTTRRTNNVNDVDASDGHGEHDDDNGVGCGVWFLTLLSCVRYNSIAETQAEECAI